MRPGGGKAKGASFEREVCRKLSMWLSGGVHEDVLWRSAMSGGRATVSARKGKRLAAQAGDISCIHPCGQKFMERYYIECKSYRDLQFVGLLTGKGALVNFWEETKKQAESYGKIPMLVAKQNQYPPFIILSHDGFVNLGLFGLDTLKANSLGLYLVLLSDFLEKAGL